MTEKILISSMTNDKVKKLKSLVKSSKARNDEKVFVVEGIKMYREIPLDYLEEVYVSETFITKNQEEFMDEEYIILKDNIFNSISDTKSPQGIMAVVNFVNNKLEVLLQNNPLIIILEQLQDPGNMGTIIRTAEGAGVTGILIGEDCVDIYNPKVVRSTMGSIFRVPIVKSNNLMSDINKIKSDGVSIYGAHLDGEDFYNISYLGGTAFLVGNEGNGLSKEISDTADALIRIPMEGKVESLNASISASLLIYETLRQRKT